MLKIALDLDGVLADSISVWLAIWNALKGSSLKLEDVKSWDFWKELGITSGEFHRIFYKTWKNWQLIPPTEPDLVSKVSMLEELGKVDIVTSRPKNTREYVLKWLERHGLGKKNILFVKSNKSELDYDVYIDDSPVNAEEIASVGKYVALYDRPWNKCVKNTDRIKRVMNLEEAYSFIKTHVLKL
ncbi:MAG: hypothetical protein LZ170_05375 [Thaumarchaeota archaeon]|jgi:5'(3')-deoxyribonucleotidase|nr:hypothetical protein [Candidatus Terraquivivens yellowstonensis]MCL7398602.1 hypothetical protein [Candidatus Terraquivivens yellowstonensis]MCL7399639.1 hypothetical protein [Candidatus Terraquivivens yellowstonensis]MCL7400961.1 hypothetical protein [Candidatus Terraquivivens yellowstonensis]